MSVLASAPTLKTAVNWLFSEGRSARFDRVAEQRNGQYYITAAVNLTPDKDGNVSVAALKRFGLSYVGEVVSVDTLKRDRIFLTHLKSEAAWVDSCFGVVVRLSPYDGALSPEKRESKLIARLVYGLYKGDFSVAFNKASGMISSSTPFGKVTIAQLREELKERVETCLMRLKRGHGLDKEAGVTYDIYSQNDLTSFFVQAFVEARMSYGTKSHSSKKAVVQELISWGGQHLDHPGVKEAATVAQELLQPKVVEPTYYHGETFAPTSTLFDVVEKDPEVEDLFG